MNNNANNIQIEILWMVLENRKPGINSEWRSGDWWLVLMMNIYYRKNYNKNSQHSLFAIALNIHCWYHPNPIVFQAHFGPRLVPSFQIQHLFCYELRWGMWLTIWALTQCKRWELRFFRKINEEWRLEQWVTNKHD